MPGLYVNGHIDTSALVHWNIVESVKQCGRGIYLFRLERDDQGYLGNEFCCAFHEVAEFCYSSDSNENAIANNAIAQSVITYDLDYQYCAMFEIDGEIIGGAFVPFREPEELELALDYAINHHQNS